jgi:hypothetical protein
MLVEESISPQSYPSTVIGMRRSLLSSMQLSMLTAQLRPFIGPFKASPSPLSMHTLLALLDSLILISRGRKYIRWRMY